MCQPTFINLVVKTMLKLEVGSRSDLIKKILNYADFGSIIVAEN